MIKATYVTFLFILVNLIGFPKALALAVLVQDISGQPCAQCAVHVGTDPNIPFANNWGLTNSQGRISFPAVTSIQDQPVTVVAVNHPFVTYLNQSGENIAVKIPLADPIATVQVSGTFSGWVNPGAGNNISFGITVPLIDPGKVFDLQVNDLVSTTTDQISIYGKKINIPSNISLPHQSLSYGFFPITLEKAQFSVEVTANENYNLVGITGSFPFSAAESLSSANGIDMTLLNKMRFNSESILANQAASSTNVTNTVLKVGEETFTSCMQASVSNAPAGYQVVGAPLKQTLGFNSSLSSGLYQITDLKLLGADSLALNCLSGDKASQMSMLALGVAAASSGGFNVSNAMTAILARSLPQSNINLGSFLNVPALSVLPLGKTLSFSRVEQPKISPEASSYYAVLSQSRATSRGDTSAPLWIFIGSAPLTNQANAAGNPSFTVPSLPFNQNFETLTVGQKNHWELIWLAIDPNLSPVSAENDITLLQVATHASRNNIDF